MFESGKWCKVLATSEMTKESLVYVFNVKRNALTHILEVEKWIHCEGLVYELELSGFDEIMDFETAGLGLSAINASTLTGHDQGIGTIVSHELRYYPAGLLRMTPEEQEKICIEQIKPAREAIRNDPAWVDSLNYLEKEHCVSSFYDGCSIPFLLGVARKQGFLLPSDLEDARRLLS